MVNADSGRWEEVRPIFSSQFLPEQSTLFLSVAARLEPPPLQSETVTEAIAALTMSVFAVLSSPSFQWALAAVTSGALPFRGARTFLKAQSRRTTARRTVSSQRGRPRSRLYVGVQPAEVRGRQRGPELDRVRFAPLARQTAYRRRVHLERRGHPPPSVSRVLLKLSTSRSLAPLCDIPTTSGGGSPLQRSLCRRHQKMDCSKLLLT